MISDRYDFDFIRKNLSGGWKPFPPAADRKAWGGLLSHPVNRRRRKDIIKKADELLGKSWPVLSAAMYMEFARTGNRIIYEKPCFERRKNLSTLVLAECLEYKGRYMDEIANGLLAICEESTWVVPSHSHRNGQDPLPPYDSHNIDLFNSESGLLIAEVSYALEKEILALSPALHDRLRHELMGRIIVPFETHDDFWWMKGENNWGSWCALNVLGTALCVVEDKDRLARIIDRLNAVNDRFMSFYKEDGACPEGPMYWSVSAGALVSYLEMLSACTGGRINLFNEPKIREMVLFIAYSHVDGPWYANFGDSDSYLKSSRRPIIYKAGELMECDELKDFAMATYFSRKNGRPVKDASLADLSCCAHFSYYVRELFWMPADIRPKAISKRRTVWLPDLQLLVARESEAAGKGMVLTAIGGDNAMGHSHNDVGNFSVYADGEPVIIDAGIETYCRQTFSSKRYELWYTRGNAHNVPVINGIEQKHGAEFRAKNVKLEESDAAVTLQMNLEKAYPAEAGIESIVRQVSMSRTGKCSISVNDTVTMKTGKAAIDINMLSLPEPTLTRKGIVEFKSSPKKHHLEYDASMFNVKIKAFEIKDARMSASWGKKMYRLVFTLKKPAGSIEYSFRITNIEHSTSNFQGILNCQVLI